MITKQQFIESVMREISIVKHLAEKVTPENINYKPTEKQRTTRELLGYLAFGPKTALMVAKTGDMSLFGTSMADQASVTMENFSEMMDKSAMEIKSTLESMTDDEMNEEVDLWNNGNAAPRSMHIMQLVLEAFVAYKMQLFLYLKASGHEHLNTSNVWQGKDPAPKE
jgi:hypothetical protein